MRAPDWNSRGFTLIEAAVALLLLSLLFGSVFLPLHGRLDARKVDETHQLLGKAREALIGYALAHGRLPCPADDTSGGREPPGSDPATGVCRTYYGYLPAAALGLTHVDAQGYARDAWGADANRIRYAVSSHAAGGAGNSNPFTRVNGLRAAGMAALGDPALSLLHVCASAIGISPGVSCGHAATIVSTAPAVIWSVGANAAGGGRSVHEAQNPNPNGGSADRIFVSRSRSDVAETEFDDIVTWLPMSILLYRMASAGQLP